MRQKKQPHKAQDMDISNVSDDGLTSLRNTAGQGKPITVHNFVYKEGSIGFNTMFPVTHIITATLLLVKKGCCFSSSKF